jgi:eukaryotic-like serine/threonine-protein kinase
MSTDAKDDTPNELPNDGDDNDFTADMVIGNAPGERLHTTNILATGMSSSTLIAGRYQLLERIGEGGMGEVWLAQQTQPVKRRVAVKLIRPGMGSKAFLARFEQERQALAMMDHPNIAKVLDAGVADNGAPFLAMEYVGGEQLTKYCDSTRMSPRDRLALFIPICQAVQHAHQKGIVHRDLKPANILVSIVDGKPVPKVIDFGVAKATGGKLTEQSLATDFGAVVGTLEYMAPEQAGQRNEDIDTRADIYSLGVILYELLTGLRPIDGERLRKAALSEMIRIIREDDPSRPSTRLSTSESLPSLAAMRQTDPSRLMADLRGELDWVVMKCLEKSRERRYETANGLARDIQRYLTHQPVEARPPSSSYRIKKLLERNRGSAIAACLCAVLFLAGFIGTAWGLLEARKQTGVAEAKTEIAEAALLGETQARQEAEKANQQAFVALESFSNSLMEDLLGSKEALSAMDRSVLENAQKQWTVFAESKGTSKEARIISAKGATNLSSIQSKLGMNREAEANDRKSQNIWESLYLENPEDHELKRKLAKSHQNLGAILRINGAREEAGQHFRRAVKLLEQLIEKSPDDERLQMDYAYSCVSSGNSARDFGKWDDAERFYLLAFAAQEKLLNLKPEKLLNQENLAGTHWALALLYKRQEKLAEAKGHYRKAIEDFAKLVAASPETRSYRVQHANLQRELGGLLRDFSEDVAAGELLAESVASLSKIASDFPSVPIYRLDLGRARRDYAQVLGYLNKTSEATEQFTEAIAIIQRLTEAEPANLPYQADYGIAYRMYADFLAQNGKLPESLAPMTQAVQILTAAYTQDPKITLTKRALCRSHEYRADILDGLKRHAEAQSDWDQVLKLCDESMQHIHRSQRADSLLRSGQVEVAIAEVDELAKIETNNPLHWVRFAKLYAIASEKLPERKTEYVDRAIALIEKAIGLGFKDLPRLKEDPELAPLNSQPAFANLLE